MSVQLYKWLSIYLISMVKFFAGPLSAAALGLSPFETIVCSFLGMMTSVAIFSTLGSWVKINVFSRFSKSKALFTKRNRKMVALYQRFGLRGIAFLTPVIFGPIIGTMIAASFGEHKRRIFLYMFISGFVWSIALTYIFHYLKELIRFFT